MKRYHPLLVALHWILAIMILMALVLGGPAMSEMKSTDPEKMFSLTGHMIWGIVIGILLIIRFVVRVVSKKPPKADSGNKLLNFGAQAAHWGLYILVLGMVASGLGTAFSADLFSITLGGNGEPIPADLSHYNARIAHGIIANIILALIVLHIAGWAFHQFVLRDKLISRMWFGKRHND